MGFCGILVLRDTFRNDHQRTFPNLAELFGHYRINAGMKTQEISVLDRKINLEFSAPSLVYKRYQGDVLDTQATIMSDRDPVVIGVFPIPPIFTPRTVARYLYLKFKFPVIVDQRSKVVVYAKMPLEIGVFRQSEDEELLVDAFSLVHQQYALYGLPESGVVCRYADTEVSGEKDQIAAERYREALVRIGITNEIDNIVKVSKVIIPMDAIVMDHAHDDAWLSGNVEMALDSAFGKDMVVVRLLDAKVKRYDKTSLIKKEETRIFIMDAGY